MNGDEASLHFPGDREPLIENCPSCGEAMDMSGMRPFTCVACSACGFEFTVRRAIDHFRILHPVGEGGLGSVFRALDTTLDREVALKILKIDGNSDVSAGWTFEREARSTAFITHPNIVRIFDFGRCSGVFYIAMEFLGGGSLDDLIQMRGPLDEAMVLKTGIQVAEGLAAALEQGLLHRDVKPANILFADLRTAKLVDFGLATPAGDELWGTPNYIAPEKLDELPEDARSDIYSLGSTLFHALSGRPPYQTDDVPLAELRGIKKHPVDLRSAAPGVGDGTVRLVQRMMDPNPARRHQGYRDLLDHMRHALGETAPFH